METRALTSPVICCRMSRKRYHNKGRNDAMEQGPKSSSIAEKVDEQKREFVGIIVPQTSQVLPPRTEVSGSKVTEERRVK